MNERLEAIVSGKVQDVWFRDFTRTHAKELGLTGQAKNLPDGTVHVIAEGLRDRLESLLSHLHSGPQDATVASVEATWKEAEGSHADFHII